MLEKDAPAKAMIWDDIAMMILALVSGYILILQFTTALTPLQDQWLDKVDLAIALIFLCEFVVKLVLAKSKSAFLRSNWWYLLASIPISTPTTEALRLLRLLRLIRLFRLMTGMQAMESYAKRFIKQTHILYVITIWAIIVFCGTLAFYGFEHALNVHVQNLFDSLWYVMATITTVGYGDIYPITTGGRIVGMILMLVGIGTSGVLTALVASFFVKQSQAGKQ